MFNDKDDAEAWALDLLRKYGIPNPEHVKGDKESIIPIDLFNNKSQKTKNVTFLDEDDGYHD
jgi:hypothetical protein